MNKWIGIGRISKEPMFASTAAGVPVINLDVELNDFWVDREGNSKTKKTWIRAVQWGKLAELSRRIIKKGDLVSIEGSLSVSTTEHNGKKEHRTEVKIQIIEVLNAETIEKNYGTE